MVSILLIAHCLQIGSGLIVLLDLTTSHATWAAYFVLCGIGTGIAMNLPYTAVSVVLGEADVVTGNGQSSTPLNMVK
jgi:ribosomal protein S5